MDISAADKRLKEIVSEAVSEALEKQRSRITAAVIEAMEDAGLARAMEEADNEMADPREIDRLLNRATRES